MATQGTATADFGTGAVEASIAVTGQAGFTTVTNLVEAWVSGLATASNPTGSAREEQFTVIVDNEITATGFTINVKPQLGRAYGAYTVNWVYN
jgi:hypothetical protein